MSINLTIDQKLKALEVASNLACFFAQGMKMFRDVKLDSQLPLASEVKINKDELLILDGYIDLFYNYVSEKIQKLN